MSVHRFVLFAVLVLGAAALAYNAFSIMQGESGFAGLSSQLVSGQPARDRMAHVSSPGLYRWALTKRSNAAL